MGDIQHFTYGWLTPALAYALSVLGALLGLVCTDRARAAPPGRRRAWLLVMAAWAIGGTGIWVMHFMAMIGFSVTGTLVRYDVPVTVASFLIAVVFVGIGLFLAGYGPPSPVKLLFGGVITGVAVALMHYTGTAAMRMSGRFSYDPVLVGASFAIAVVAATAALWFTVVVRGTTATIAAALIMGVAVSGMHYTGMYSMSAHLHPVIAEVAAPPGVDVSLFLVPIVLFVIVVVVLLAHIVMANPSEREQEVENALRRTYQTR